MFIPNVFLVCIAVYTVFGAAVIITEHSLLSILVAISILAFPEYLTVLRILSYNTYLFMVWHIFGIMDVTEVMGGSLKLVI